MSMADSTSRMISGCWLNHACWFRPTIPAARTSRPACLDPVYASFGGTFGFDQNFNRLQVSGGATVDRTAYTDSRLTDDSSTSNDDRNFNQFGGVGRVSYDL